jgi:hypothetical protein
MTTNSAAPLHAVSSHARQGTIADQRLCAGTYLDRDFRDHVLRDVYNERTRRVAPSYGFDVVPVLRHAWRAWWVETCQYLLTLVVLAIGLTLRPLDTCIALNVLAIWYLLRLWRSWALRLIGYGSARNAELDHLDLLRDRQLLFRGRVLKYFLWASLVLLAMLMVASASSGPTERSSASWPERSGVGVAEVIIGLCAIVAAAAIARMICLGRVQSAFRLPRRLSRRMRVIDRQQRHPFTVHTEFKPFIGSGKSITSWSFAQRLVSADNAGPGRGNEFDKPPFTAQKLVDRLRNRIAELRDDQNPETRLRGLIVTDHVFVDGIQAAPFASALAGEPGSSDVERAIAEVIANPSDVARHYLGARIESWGGEIVTSVFVHVSLQGRTLYLEFATYALYPVRSEYRVEQIGRPGVPAIARAVGRELISLPDQLLAVRRLARAPARLCASLGAGTDRTSAASLRRDIGATSCVRERAMIEVPAEFRAESESGYFQSQDIIQHSKIVERQLIAAVGDYLIELGVDSSEFVQRTTTILNNGVMNMGSGTVSIEQSAIGAQSSVVLHAATTEG